MEKRYKSAERLLENHGTQLQQMVRSHVIFFNDTDELGEFETTWGNGSYYVHKPSSQEERTQWLDEMHLHNKAHNMQIRADIRRNHEVLSLSLKDASGLHI